MTDHLYYASEADAETAAGEIWTEVVDLLGETPAGTTGWAEPEYWSGRWRIPDPRATEIVEEGDADAIVAGLSPTPVGETLRDPVMALPELAAMETGPALGLSPVSTVGSLPASGNFGNFVLLEDGRQIAGPRSATEMLLYDPSDDTFIRSAFGATLPGSSSHYGGALGCDGNAYFAPNNDGRTLIYNPKTNTATLTDFGVTLPAGSGRFAGFVANRDRTILAGIASDADYILLVYPATQTAEIWYPAGCDLSGSSKFRGGVLGHDGRIYVPPYSTDGGFLIIDLRDPEAKSAFRSTLGATIPAGSARWLSMVLCPDGRAFGIPFAATTFAVVDTIAGTATMDTLGLTMTSSNKWAGGCLGLDKRIYGAPYDRNTVPVIDPETNSASEIEVGISGSAKYLGMVTSPSGNLYAPALQATNILKVSTTSGNDLSAPTLLSTYMNSL